MSTSTSQFEKIQSIFQQASSLYLLLSIVGVEGMLIIGGWLFSGLASSEQLLSFPDVARNLGPLALGLVTGAIAALAVRHPRRSLGLLPPVATVNVIAFLWASRLTLENQDLWFPAFLVGFTTAVMSSPLRVNFANSVSREALGVGTSLVLMGTFFCTLLLGGVVVAGRSLQLLNLPQDGFLLLGGISAIAAVLCWWFLTIPLIELTLAILLWPCFRIRKRGASWAKIPTQGPLIIIANHATYFDPFWLGKVFPRKLTPMMTSVFFDKPGIRWLMVHVVEAIRVQQSRYRREAPELQEAIRVLRAGGAVLIFPEAILRRTEEQLLRRFGRGVWTILQELPNTPVVTVWIEGGWGSWSSYKNGPPFTNKRPDFWRKIDIAVSEPTPLPAEVLADQWRTREYLMRGCLECRRSLGLEVPVQGEVEESPQGEEQA